MDWLWKSIAPLKVDIHSHILPGIDDGARNIDQSISMIRALQDAGFEKLITTPHIHPKYPNTESQIKEEMRKFKEVLLQKDINIQLAVAAEYFADHLFIDKIDANEPLLTFGDNFVLIECSFTVKPFFFQSLIYKLQDQGYNPVFAHPERYKFLEGDIDWLVELKRTGILFQITLGSLGGYYGNSTRKIARQLIKEGMVDFFGSDLHKVSQVEFMKKGLGIKEVQKLVSEGRLLNNQLI